MSLALNLKQFYTTKAGRIIRRFINNRLQALWPDVKNCNILGYGYALPYLRRFSKADNIIYAAMPDTLGVHFQSFAKDNTKGGTCLVRENTLPFETESIDRIVMAHGLDYAEDMNALLQEIWRVLKSSGRVIIIVPNRRSSWARADWTPFGHGLPYSKKQIIKLLSDNLFVHQRTEQALFAPPVKSFFTLRIIYLFERIAAMLVPSLAGVHIIEVSKQVYAGKTVRSTSKKQRYAVADKTVQV